MKRKIICNFDGACEKPGGKMGSGYVIYEDGKILYEDYEHYKKEEINTCNVAEYYGVLTLFERLIELSLENEDILVYGDSNLAIKQLSGEWGVSRGNYVEHARLALDIKPQFTTIQFQWVPREENKYADMLSKKGLKNEKKIKDLEPELLDCLSKMTEEEYKDWIENLMVSRMELRKKELKKHTQTEQFKRFEAEMLEHKDELVLIYNVVHRLDGVTADQHDIYWKVDDGKRMRLVSGVLGWVPLKSYLPTEIYNTLITEWNFNTNQKAK